jgi:hypothetical protein
VVFACRGWFPESIGKIKADYRRGLSEVLREAIVQIIPNLRKLGDLFKLISYCPAVPGAPSWTLNLTCGEYVDRAMHYFGMWNAIKWISPNTARVSLDSEVLHVNGIIVDQVSVLSGEFPPYVLGD